MMIATDLQLLFLAVSEDRLRKKTNTIWMKWIVGTTAIFTLIFGLYNAASASVLEYDYEIRNGENISSSSKPDIPTKLTPEASAQSFNVVSSFTNVTPVKMIAETQARLPELGVIVAKHHHHHHYHYHEWKYNRRYIGRKAAKRIALNHAGANEAAVRKYDSKVDKDDSRIVYEIEFVYADMEYEYQIDAFTGEIVHYEREPD
jgi:uncharacterized membrane protein YkoI